MTRAASITVTAINAMVAEHHRQRTHVDRVLAAEARKQDQRRALAGQMADERRRREGRLAAFARQHHRQQAARRRFFHP